VNYLHPSEIERLSHLSNHPFDEIRADSLTPADYILLADVRWVPARDAPGLVMMARKPRTEAMVRALATAFLVNERAGNVRLLLTKSRYVHFNRFQHVEVAFVRRQHHWPAESLEARLGASGKVLDLIGGLLETGLNSHASLRDALCDRLLHNMAVRGLIKRDVESRRSLVVMRRKRERYLLGPRVREALRSEAANTASRFIAASAETRPELTEELLRDVRAILSA
jgi:hypothetical protein